MSAPKAFDVTVCIHICVAIHRICKHHPSCSIRTTRQLLHARLPIHWYWFLSSSSGKWPVIATLTSKWTVGNHCKTCQTVRFQLRFQNTTAQGSKREKHIDSWIFSASNRVAKVVRNVKEQHLRWIWLATLRVEPRCQRDQPKQPDQLHLQTNQTASVVQQGAWTHFVCRTKKTWMWIAKSFEPHCPYNSRSTASVILTIQWARPQSLISR